MGPELQGRVGTAPADFGEMQDREAGMGVLAWAVVWVTRPLRRRDSSNLWVAGLSPPIHRANATTTTILN